ncbi:hypothetical protein [Hymenobacter wooponensis]|uniref:ATP-dependent DNA helicase n=1 Tax=Hymenobacter wooponensis TaxID=1525360 RepID=A0A4Z0MVI4_9BACT|nr:hypothetical protein [Hymenobacter wooponensis]TGD83145.1 hypothetical protein EU557_05030 [Hymenobacter wooponensis]
MKASLFSLVAALGLFASSASFAAAAPSDPYKARKEAIRYDRKAEVERARREAAQRKYELERQRQAAAQQRARLEAQRRQEQQRAAERARWEAQHRHDDHGRDYGYRR